MWLAARYRRAAFAEEFETRLKEKSARLDGKLAKALNPAGEHILAVFFDVDSGEEKTRNGPSDLYQLQITLLYNGAKDEQTAYLAAQKAADTIEDFFEKACCEGGTWKNIHLLSCAPISSQVMTIAESRLLKQWRLDYMSLEDDPQQAHLE